MDTLDLAVGLLAHGGRLVLMAGLDQQPRFPVGPFYTKNTRAVGFTITAATTSELAEAAAINALLGAGRLRVRIDRALPLAEARLAHQLVEGGGPSGHAGEKAKGRVVVVMPSVTPSARAMSRPSTAAALASGGVPCLATCGRQSGCGHPLPDAASCGCACSRARELPPANARDHAPRRARYACR